MTQVLRDLVAVAESVESSAAIPEEVFTLNPSTQSVPNVLEPMPEACVHFHPTQQGVEATNMCEQELLWAHGWRAKIIALLVPHAELMPHVRDVLKRDNPQGELRDLFGGSRKQHCLNLRSMLQVQETPP
eukprot:609086-Amphidinium_carterae.1